MGEDGKEKNQGDGEKNCSDWDDLMKKMLLPSAKSSKAHLVPGRRLSGDKGQKSMFDFLMCSPLRTALGCSNREDQLAAIIRLLAEKLVCLEAKVRVLEKRLRDQESLLIKTVSEKSEVEAAPEPPSCPTPPPPPVEREVMVSKQDSEDDLAAPKEEERQPPVESDESEEPGTSHELMNIHLRPESNEHRHGHRPTRTDRAKVRQQQEGTERKEPTMRKTFMRDVYLRKDLPSRRDSNALYFFTEGASRTPATREEGEYEDAAAKMGSNSTNVAQRLVRHRYKRIGGMSVCFSARPTSSSDSFVLPAHRSLRRHLPRRRR